MNKQMRLSGLNDELAQVRTKKKEFLEQIERIVPWGKWVSMIKPCYYKGERGNTIPRPAKTDRQAEYDVCVGKPDSG